MSTRAPGRLEAERTAAINRIVENMSVHLSPYEMSDVPQILSSFILSSLRTIADETDAVSTAKVGEAASKYQIRLIRSIIGRSDERYVLTALKSRSYFIKDDEVERSFGEPDALAMGPIEVNRNMEDTFKLTQFRTSRFPNLVEGYSYDAERHAAILKTRRLADSIRLESMFDLHMDYYRELGILQDNIDLIETSLSAVLHAAHIAYLVSKTLPDGSGLRPLLDANAVIDIATYCGGNARREELLLALMTERRYFDKEMLEMLAEAPSDALAEGTL